MDKGYKLPNNEQLIKMANAMGYNETNCGKLGKNNYTGGLIGYYSCKKGNIDKSMINNSTYVWSSDRISQGLAHQRYFTANSSVSDTASRNGTSQLTICIK